MFRPLMFLQVSAFTLLAFGNAFAIESGQQIEDPSHEFPLLASHSGQMCSGFRIGRFIFTAHHCFQPEEKKIRAYFGNDGFDVNLEAADLSYAENDVNHRVSSDFAMFSVSKRDFRKNPTFWLSSTATAISCAFVPNSTNLSVNGYGPADGTGPELKVGEFVVSRTDRASNNQASPIEILSGSLERFQGSIDPMAAAELISRSNPLFSNSGIRVGDSGGPVFLQEESNHRTMVGVVSHGHADRTSGLSLSGAFASFSGDSLRKFLCDIKNGTPELAQNIDSNCCP